MCSYPRINGQYACENDHLLNDILKGDWDFPGFVLTDYLANKSTVNSLNNGLDLDIFPGTFLQPPLVNAALAGNQVSPPPSTSTCAASCARCSRSASSTATPTPDDAKTIDADAHHTAAGEIEQQGIVLLKNDDALLPLDAAKVGKVAVIGPEADAIKNGGGSSAINSFKKTTVAQRAERAARRPRRLRRRQRRRARPRPSRKGADVAVVVVGDQMTEGKDKSCMTLSCDQPDGIDREALIAAVAAANPRTVVVLQSGGPVETPWRDSVPAILEAWFPGDAGGAAVDRVLFGDAEPGGRLPATFPKSYADEPTAGDPEKYPGVGEVVKYKEDVLIGYRWFDEQDKDVAFPFGFGLTYTTFSYKGLRLEPSADATEAVVSVRVKNTGKRAGSAVPQLYVGMPEPDASTVQPPWQLKGFDKVLLQPGKARRVRFTLDDRAFSYWAGERLARRAGLLPDRRRRALARPAAPGCRRPRRRVRGRAAAPRVGEGRARRVAPSASTCRARSSAPASGWRDSGSGPCAARAG